MICEVIKDVLVVCARYMRTGNALLVGDVWEAPSQFACPRYAQQCHSLPCLFFCHFVVVVPYAAGNAQVIGDRAAVQDRREGEDQQLHRHGRRYH